MNVSSHSSRDQYHSSSRRHAHRQSLPPLRSVLGDQLTLPVAQHGRQSPYDLDDISRALPPARTEYRTRTVSNAGYPSPSYYSRGNSSAQPGHVPRSMTPTFSTHQTSGGPADAMLSPPPKPGSVKKHICTWEGCDKRFERQHALDTHMNIHLEQKPFACPVPHCGKVFNVRSNMRRHLLTHKNGGLQDSQFEQDYDAENEERTARHFQKSARDSNSKSREYAPSSYAGQHHHHHHGTASHMTSSRSQSYYNRK